MRDNVVNVILCDPLHMILSKANFLFLGKVAVFTKPVPVARVFSGVMIPRDNENVGTHIRENCFICSF